MQVLEGDDNRLRPCASQNQGGHCRQLPAPQVLGWEGSQPLQRQWNVYERRNQGRVFCNVEADQPQRHLEICKTLLGGGINAEALPTPFRDGM